MWKLPDWQDIWPRLLTDFAIMHLSMLTAMAISVIYQTAAGEHAQAAVIINQSLQYYSAFFCPLSLLFPAVFLINGFYTRTRGYADKYKMLVVLRGAALAALLFFASNVLLFGKTTIGRSVAIPFVVLASVGIPSARILKALIESYGATPKAALKKRAGSGRILVIGGAGYIGSLLVRSLLEKGHTVRVWDSLIYGDDALRPVKGHPHFELLAGDCRNIQDMVKAMREVESVIHLGAIVGDPACEQDRASALEINYAATRMLIEVAKGHGVSRFIFASSCSVYGASELETDENSALSPISLYAQTKIDSERVLLEEADSAFQPTILRFATVFGLGYRPRFDLVANLLTAQAYRENAITIFNGEQWRPFIHVRDLVEAIRLTLDGPLALVGGEVFNVGDSRLNHTLADLAGIISEVFPNTRVHRVENADKRNYRVSFSKFQNRLGFRAHYSLKDGVVELKQAFEDGLISDYKDPRYNNQRYLSLRGAQTSKNQMDTLVMAAFAVAGRPVGQASACSGLQPAFLGQEKIAKGCT